MIKYIKIIVVFITIFNLSGCAGKIEVDSIGIVNIITIDKIKETGKYTIGVQIVAPQRPDRTSNENRVWSISATDDTIMKASKKLQSQVPKKIIFFHSKLIIIGENLAREGLLNTVDFFARNEQIKYNSWILITKGNALDLLYLNPHFQDSLAQEIEGLIKNIPNWSNSYTINLKDLLARLSIKYRDEIIGVITYDIPDISPGGTFSQEDLSKGLPLKEKLLLHFDKTAVFKDGKFKGWFNEEENRGYLWITGKIHKGTLVIKDQQNPLYSLNILSSETVLKPEIKNDKINYLLQIKTELFISEQFTKLDLTILKNVQKLKDLTKNKIKEDINSALNKAQKEYNTDIFNFGNILYKSKPKKWNEIKTNWNELYPTIKTNIQINVVIRNLGELTNSIQQKY